MRVSLRPAPDLPPTLEQEMNDHARGPRLRRIASESATHLDRSPTRCQRCRVYEATELVESLALRLALCRSCIEPVRLALKAAHKLAEELRPRNDQRSGQSGPH